MLKFLRHLSRVAAPVNQALAPSLKWQPQKVTPSFLQRKELVESIERSLKPDIELFPGIGAISTKAPRNSMETQLETLKSTWTHLFLTYGLSQDHLYGFASYYAEKAAEQLPKCKLVSVLRMFDGDTAGGPYINDHMVSFAEERGIALDPLIEPDHYHVMHQLVVDFGKAVCEKYPLIFRDLYLYYVRDNAPYVRVMQRLHPQRDASSQRSLKEDYFYIDAAEHGSRRSVLCFSALTASFFISPSALADLRGECDPRWTLLEYLEDSENLDHWYRFTDEMDSELDECHMRFIRSLSPKPFDPIAQTDMIDPEVQLKVWERAGILASAPVSVHLKVEIGHTPPPLLVGLIPAEPDKVQHS